MAKIAKEIKEDVSQLMEKYGFEKKDIVSISFEKPTDKINRIIEGVYYYNRFGDLTKGEETELDLKDDIYNIIVTIQIGTFKYEIFRFAETDDSTLADFLDLY